MIKLRRIYHSESSCFISSSFFVLQIECGLDGRLVEAPKHRHFLLYVRDSPKNIRLKEENILRIFPVLGQ